MVGVYSRRLIPTVFSLENSLCPVSYIVTQRFLAFMLFFCPRRDHSASFQPGHESGLGRFSGSGPGCQAQEYRATPQENPNQLAGGSRWAEKALRDAAREERQHIKEKVKSHVERYREDHR